jgi:hypothetical protein
VSLPAEVVLAELADLIADRVAERVAAKLAERSTPAPEAPSRLLSKGDLARELGCSTSTVDRMANIPFVVIGRNKRFDLATVRTWLEKREPSASTSTSASAATDDRPAVHADGVQIEGMQAGVRMLTGGRNKR